MPRTFFLVSTLALAAPVVASERQFQVGAFEAIRAAGPHRVEVTTGSAPSVVATGDQAVLDRLDIRVERGALVIGQRRGMPALGRAQPATIRVTTQRLTEVSVAGSGDMRVSRVTGPSFTGNLAGSGNLELASIASDSLTFSVAGSGDARGSGRCGTARYSVSGSGNIRAGNIACKSLTVAINGSGNVDGQASGPATVAINGSGNARITGGAQCTQAVRGSGRVTCS
ncbi:MAG: head GIN domain-containing protein [Thermaurantiacus sp.]